MLLSFSDDGSYQQPIMENLKKSIVGNDLTNCQYLFKRSLKSDIELHIRSDLLLHEAVKHSSIEVLQFIVENVNPDLLMSKDDAGKTPLHLAVSKKHLSACKLLLNSKTLKEKDKAGNNPFHSIVRDNFFECFSEAMEHVDQSIIKGINGKNETPLHIAASENSDGVILRKLLKAGARVDVRTPKGTTPLHVAAEKGFDICVKTLLEFVQGEKKQQLLDKPNKEGQTALIHATKKGFTKCCKLMLGANLNHQDNTGCTALHWACSKGSISCVKYLLSNNADPSIKDKKKQTALYKAAANDNSDCLIFLLDNTELSVEEHDDILFIATRKKSYRCVEELLNREDSKNLINKQDSHGNTCLHLAIRDRLFEIAEALLQAGACRDIANYDEEYPLHFAAALAKGSTRSSQQRRSQLCNRLLKRSYMMVNKCTTKEETPLHYAARSDNVEVARALLLRGCKLLKKNKDGLGSIHIAAKDGHHSVLQVMLTKFKMEKRKTNILEEEPQLLHLATESGHLECCKVIVDVLKVCFI